MKRIVSLMLALCIVFTLLPVFTVGAESGITIKYGMSKGLGYNFANATFISTIDYDATNGFYRYVEKSKTARADNYYTTFYQDLRLYCSGVGDYVAFGINVPAAGVYDVTFNYFKFKEKIAGGYGSAWILPGSTADIASAISDNSTAIADFEYFTEAAESEDASKTVNSVSFPTAGEYYLVYKLTGENSDASNTSNSRAMYPSDVILASETVNGPLPMKCLLSFSKTSLRVGEKSKLSVKTVLSDSTWASGASVSYESLTPSVATVDSATGEIEGISAGTASFRATSVINGIAVVSEPVSVSVVSDSMAGYRAVYDFTNGFANGDSIKTITYDETNSFWRFHSSNLPSKDFKVFIDENNRYLNIQSPPGYWYALAINVPKKGEYNVKLDYLVSTTSGGIGSIYILPGDAEDIPAALESAEALAADINYWDSSVAKNTMRNKDLGIYNFPSAGEYIIVFKGAKNDIPQSGGGIWASGYMFPGKITLEGGEKAALMSAKIKGFLRNRPVLEGVMSDGSSADFSDASVKYKSSDESVASIDADTGIITDKSSGTTTITADIVLDGIKKSVSAEYSCVKAEPSGVKIVYDIIRDFEYKYDVRTIGYADTDDTWRWFCGSAANIAPIIHPSYGMATNGTSTGQWVAIEIKVPAAGKYNVEFEHGVATTGGCTGGMWIIPKNSLTESSVSEISDLLTEDSAITNQIEYYDNSISASVIATTEDLGNITIPSAGEYLVVWKNLIPRKSNVMYPGKITLDGRNAMKVFEVSVDKTELEFGEKGKIDYTAARLDGNVIPKDEYKVMFSSQDENIVSVDAYGNIEATGDGNCKITVTATDGENTLKREIMINAHDNTGIKSTELVLASNKIYIRGTTTAEWYVIMNSGNRIRINNDDIKVESADTSVVRINPDKTIVGVGAGKTTVSFSTEFKGIQLSESRDIEVSYGGGKTTTTYYTEEMRQTARENIKKYSWANDAAKSAVSNADKYLNNIDVIYDMIPSEGIPRSTKIRLRGDPDYMYCPICGENVVGKYGGSNGVGGWTINFINRPWKLQCPECKRMFPSNDFEGLYKLVKEKDGGVYTPERGLYWNEWSKANGGKDYLKNELYPEMGEGWGVDYGLGYDTGEKSSNGSTDKVYVFLGQYHYSFWNYLQSVIIALSDAYLYTGDIKYARAGAVLIDRVADVCPGFDEFKTFPSKKYEATDGGSGRGKMLGQIQDATLFKQLTVACDVFYPVIENNDEQVVSYLSRKAEKFGLENDKASPEKIWQNWEENLLMEAFTAIKDCRIAGNFGMKQDVLSAAAVILDREPETSEMIEWLFQTNVGDSATATGGDLYSTLIDKVDRDGCGNEAAPNYNTYWLTRLYQMADNLAKYQGDKNYNPYDIPKFAKMFLAPGSLLLTGNHTAQIGDTGAAADLSVVGSLDGFISAFKYLKDKPEFAKPIAEYIYVLNGHTTDGLHYSIWDDNPESLKKEIEKLVDANIMPQSELMSGFGFGVLRAGSNYKSNINSNSVNNSRDMWMYFGSSGGHGHKDTLTLGMEAFGINIAPDLGYPPTTGTDPERLQWVSSTVSHNTVSVNKKEQSVVANTRTPLHFDDSGKVKVMDISASDAYKEASIYRRTVVMVEVDDSVSYGVDFFRVKGGDSHVFSFHSQSEKATAAEGLDMVPQVDAEGNYVGSYAGADVPFGRDPNSPPTWFYETVYPRGYTWLKNVRRDKNPQKQFSVDFEVTDYNKAATDNRGIHLRMTQMNDFNADEVAIAQGKVPVKKGTERMPEGFDYVLVSREGKNLDSLFTTVYEPYKNNRYVENIEQIGTAVVSGTEGANDEVRAVKVTHTNGRQDYIVYATNNSVTYRVDDKFEFRGFIGVYSLNSAGEVFYRYLNDGDIIGENTGKDKAITGTVLSYQREHSSDNYIDVTMPSEDIEKVVGKYIFVANDEVQNAVYKIEDAYLLSDGQARLSTGTTSLIRGHKDKTDINGGYIYNIAKGQSYEIPLSFVDENLPEFEPLEDVTATAESSISIKITANSPLGKELTYEATSLPAGASFNADTRTITWKPSSSQVGDNHFAITATDEDGRESTLHFMVKVYGATTQGGGSGGAGGGGGGGGTPTPTPEPEPTPTPDPEPTPNPEPTPDPTPGDNDGGFVDIDNYAWAKDSINALAKEGIIKGTSEDTFSPSSNITRADFAILLVRAFKLTGEGTENFADVDANDYFARELAIAKENGIVGGIGDNKYAPRETITREDMMVIVYRALTALGMIDKTNAERNDTQVVPYEDFDSVADYAKDAVSYLIANGLVNGKNGLIDPKAYTTRAEVAVLVKRILDFIAK